MPGRLLTVVTTRLLALVLALIIGSPACWCCAQAAPQPKKAKHSCCEQSAPEDSRPATPKDPCPCGSSMIRREMAKTIIDVPPPAPTLPLVILLGGALIETPLPPARVTAVFNDTGPPDGRPPIFLRQHALRL
jgi:hypothetical protein